MKDISQKLAGLSPQQRALLALRLKKQGQEFNTFPLSFAQQRLWFLDQLAPGNPAYNLPIIVHLSGQLNVDAMRRSLDEIQSSLISLHNSGES